MCSNVDVKIYTGDVLCLHDMVIVDVSPVLPLTCLVKLTICVIVFGSSDSVVEVL